MSSPRERDDVRVGTNRCPYCHDDVSIESTDWVSCRSCQARHHDACWTESGVCASCGEEVRLQTPEQGAPERLKAGVGAFLLPLLLLPQFLLPLVAGSALALPAWVYVAMVSLLVFLTLHKLLNPSLILDPTGLEIRKGLRSFYVRYADVLESKPGSLGTWRLEVQKESGGTRTLSLPLYELRKADRARVRATLEGLPRRTRPARECAPAAAKPDTPPAA